MSNPTPTIEQAINATLGVLQAGSLSATILPFEDRRKSPLETMREYQKRDGSYETELLFIDAQVDGVEGRTFGEKYAIYNFKLRHLYTIQDEEQISRIGKYRAEQIRNLLEGNASVFRIGSQVPLRTSETVDLQGEFIEVDDSKYYESKISFSVEARKWS